MKGPASEAHPLTQGNSIPIIFYIWNGMDEYNSGMDPEVKRYFRKILSSFSWGLLWLLAAATAGLFFGLALIRDGFRWYNLIFYLLLVLSFLWLIRYYIRLWKN